MATQVIGKVGITFNDEWESGIDYKKCCIVLHDGISYISKREHRSSDGTATTDDSSATIAKNDPATDVNGQIEGTYWLRLQGSSGDVGSSAHIEVSTSTDSDDYKHVYIQTWEGEYNTYEEAVAAGVRTGVTGDLMSPVNEVLAAVESIIGTQSN